MASLFLGEKVWAILEKLTRMVYITLRRAKDFEARQAYEPSLGATPDEPDFEIKDDSEFDYVPHFQRVSVSGEDTSGVLVRGQSIYSQFF